MPSKKPTKKATLTVDTDDSTTKGYDSNLVKRRPDILLDEDGHNNEEFDYDAYRKVNYIFIQKALSGHDDEIVRGGDKNYMLRKTSNQSQTVGNGKSKQTLKVADQSKSKPPGTGSGKRGRPRKHRQETNDITPANWKWRSNVSVPLTDLGKVTCQYKGCQQTVNTVLYYKSKRKEWALHMLDHLNIEHNTCSVCGKVYFNPAAFKSHIDLHLRSSRPAKNEPSPPKLTLSSQGLDEKVSLTKQEYGSFREFDVF